ncbi:TPA: WYL domain-containing protein, partial [Enterobacter ludwigii]|nr:WYL domain-containing protein [Enterobacter ludwigii]
LPNIQILEPNWLKEKLLKTLENYLAVERTADNHVISIT